MRTVRGHFIGLATAIVVPAFLISAFLMWWDAEREREALERDLLGRARILSQAIEREMRVSIAALEAVRHSTVLMQGDVQAFIEVAKQLHADHPHWNGVVLTDREGQQVFNLAAQPGRPLPNIAHYEVIRGALAGRASVSELLVGRVLPVNLVGIDVPVWIDGHVKYALGLSMPASYFQNILASHPVPKGWIIGVVDQKGIIVARSVDPTGGVGKPTAPFWMTTEKPEDIVRGIGRLDIPIVGAYARSELSGWRALVSVPVTVLNEQRNRRILALGLGSGALLLAGGAGAILLGRRVVRPIEHLARDAALYLQQTPPDDSAVKALDETRILAESLTRAGHDQRQALAARGESDKQFKLLVEGVSDYALYMLDPNGNVSTWNSGALRIKGYSAEEIVGKHFSKFYTNEDREAGEPQRALEAAEQNGRFEKESWRVRKDGTRFWAHVVIDAIRDDNGKLIGYAKITRDITERKRSQELLDGAREALLQSQKMEAIGQLTGGVAHDFNNLLMVVLSSLELMRKRLPDDAKLMALLENAVQGAQRGSTLTKRMLAFARRQELKKEVIDIPQLVSGMSDLLQRSLGPSIVIETHFPVVSKPVLGDANQLEMILLNLTVNARDAMPNGGQIVIATREEVLRPGEGNQLRPGTYVCLTVRDTGTGMDEVTLHRAMEPFFTTKGTGKGTGLGLSMVHGVAEQSGGWFTLRSRLGEGTTAELWLPVAEGQASASRSEEVLTDKLADLPSLTILAIDDDGLVLTNTVAMLGELGHSAIAASSGKQALDILRKHGSVDLVITDYAMPQMTGLELANAIKKQWPHIPVIIATGFAEMAAEVDTTLPKLAKPFTEAELAKMLDLDFLRAGDGERVLKFRSRPSSKH